MKIEQKNEVIATATEKLEEQKSHLAHKQSELDIISKETEKEEQNGESTTTGRVSLE